MIIKYQFDSIRKNQITIALGAIGEETDVWPCGLTDGTNTQRQLTDATSEVTYSPRYTPWGDTLEASGTGNLTFGYFGGLMDAATGLRYVGDGQYYDPSTGRFLTRNAKPNQSNPYLPFDPTGAMLGCFRFMTGIPNSETMNKWIDPRGSIKNVAESSANLRPGLKS